MTFIRMALVLWPSNSAPVFPGPGEVVVPFMGDSVPDGNLAEILKSEHIDCMNFIFSWLETSFLACECSQSLPNLEINSSPALFRTNAS